MDLTQLEKFAFASVTDFDEISSWTLGAIVKGRDNTGHGFFTEFEPSISGRSPPKSRNFCLPDIVVQVGDRSILMGFILWFEDDATFSLEGFQYGDETGTLNLKEFNLYSIFPLEYSS